MGPPTRSYFDDFTRQPTQESRTPSSSNLPRAVASVPEAQSIIGPDGALYYRASSRRCYHCMKEGHIRSQCPLLSSSVYGTVMLGPEHPDTPTVTRQVPPPRVRFEEVNTVEPVDRPSGRDSVTDHRIMEISDDEDFEWEEEEEDRMYGEGRDHSDQEN